MRREPERGAARARPSGGGPALVGARGAEGPARDLSAIRPATEADLPALAALAQRTWADAFAASLPAEDAAAELEATRSEAWFARALAERTTLVAEADGALLGYVQFGAVDIAGVEAGPDDRELHRLYVETALHGRGLGRRLARAALAHPGLAAAPRVWLQVWEENERAVRLYERLGFRRVGTTRFSIGGEVVEDLVMRLDR